MRSFLKDMLGYLPAQIVPAIAGIAFLPVITRLLSPEEYGQYTLVMATVSVLTILTGWVSMAVVRFYPACKDEESFKALYSSVFVWLELSVAVLGAVFLSVTLAQVMPARLFGAMLLGVFLFVLLAVSDVLQSLLRVRRLVHLYTVSAIWKALAGLGLGIWLAIAWNSGVKGLLWGSILAVALAIPFLWAVSTRGVRFGLGDFSFNLSKEMAKYSFPLMAGNLAAWILSLSDRYVLEFFRGSFEVGLYSVSYRVSESSIMLLNSLFAFTFNPLSIIVWEKQGEEAGRRFVEEGTRYFLILCLPAVVGLSVLQKPVVSVLTGREYWEGASVLPWVAAGVFFLGLTQRFGAGLSFHKRTTSYMLCVLAAGGLNLVLNFAFIPSFGFRAAAISTTVSYAFLLALTVWVSRRFFRWCFPFGSLIRVGAASTVMGAAVYLLGKAMSDSPITSLIVTISSGVMLYAVALLLLGEIQSDEKRALQELFARHLPGRFTPASWKKMP
jgi:O-antigen/teichoic acid export membrane protein